MKAYRGVEIELHSFLTLELDGGEWSASHPSRFIAGKEVQFTLERKLSGLSGENNNCLSLTGFELRINRAVARHRYKSRLCKNSCSCWYEYTWTVRTEGSIVVWNFKCHASS